MRLAALVLGIAGGVLAPLGMYLIVEVWGENEAATVFGLAFYAGAVPTAVIGIAGAVRSLSRPRLAAFLMLTAGLWGAGWGWLALTILGWPLLLIAAVLGFMGSRRSASTWADRRESA